MVFTIFHLSEFNLIFQKYWSLLLFFLGRQYVYIYMYICIYLIINFLIIYFRSHGRTLGLYADFLHAAVSGQGGWRTTETGILYSQAVCSVGWPRLLQTWPQRAADHWCYRWTIRAQRGGHWHCTAVCRTAGQVRFTTGIRHRYCTTAITTWSPYKHIKQNGFTNTAIYLFIYRLLYTDNVPILFLDFPNTEITKFVS